jgi:hypothetical protein
MCFEIFVQEEVIIVNNIQKRYILINNMHLQINIIVNFLVMLLLFFVTPKCLRNSSMSHMGMPVVIMDLN